jgi:hypothetical protein
MRLGDRSPAVAEDAEGTAEHTGIDIVLHQILRTWRKGHRRECLGAKRDSWPEVDKTGLRLEVEEAPAEGRLEEPC